MLIVVTLLPCFLFGQKSYVVDQLNRLHEINASSGNIHQVTELGTSFSDISFGVDGNLYGIKGNGNLYRVDTLSGEIELIYTFEGATYNSLTTAADGTIYVVGTSGELRSINTETGEVEFYGTTNAQVGGDLTFISGQLLLGGLGNRIYKLNIGDLGNSEILFTLGVPGQITGLTSVLFDCDSITIYAFVTGLLSGGTEMYKVDVVTSQSRLIRTFPFEVRGAASLYEPFNSRGDPSFLEIDSLVFDQPTCSLPTTDVEVFWLSNVGDVDLMLDGLLVNSLSFVSDVSVGTHQIIISDAIECRDSLVFEIECTIPTSITPATRELLVEKCYPVPTKNSVFIRLTEQLNGRQVQLFTVSGQNIPCHYTSNGDSISVDLSMVDSGIYLINIAGSFLKIIKI